MRKEVVHEELTRPRARTSRQRRNKRLLLAPGPVCRATSHQHHNSSKRGKPYLISHSQPTTLDPRDREMTSELLVGRLVKASDGSLRIDCSHPSVSYDMSPRVQSREEGMLILSVNVKLSPPAPTEHLSGAASPGSDSLDQFHSLGAFCTVFLESERTAYGGGRRQGATLSLLVVQEEVENVPVPLVMAHSSNLGVVGQQGSRSIAPIARHPTQVSCSTWAAGV